jgi:uncharacterized protein involved in outer membrane biogenesis
MKKQIKERMINVVRSKITIIAALLLVMYTLTGFFLVPFLAGHFVPGMLSERLQSKVTLEKVSINPYSLTMEVLEFKVKEPSGEPLAGFERLHVNFQLSSLFRWAFTFRDVILDNAFLNMVITKDGSLNLQRLAGNGADEPEPAPDTSKDPLRVMLFNLEINEARIDVTDNRQPQPAKLSFYPLTVQFADISTIPEQDGNYFLTATGGDGTVLNGSGNMTLHPFRSEGVLAFRHVPVETPWSFFRSTLNILAPQGEMNLETRYLFDIGKDTTIASLDDLHLQLKDLDFQLEENGEPFLELPAVDLGAQSIDMIGRRVQDLRIAITDGHLDINSDRGGVFNLQKIVRVKNGANPATPPQEASAHPGEPWTFDISSVTLEGIGLAFRDKSMTPERILSTQDINLNLRAVVTTDFPQPGVQMDDLALALQKITLGFDGAPHPGVQVGTLTVKQGSLDLAGRSASVSYLEVSDGIIEVIYDTDETLNLASLFDTEVLAPSDLENKSFAEESSPWNILIDTFALKNFAARITDETVQPGKPLVDLKDIRLSLSQFDGTSAFPFEAALQVSQGGAVQASGLMDPSAVSLGSTIAIENLALPIIQPYLDRTADLTLQSGLLSTKGTFNKNNTGEMTYQGQASIAGLDVIENSTRETMLGWALLKTPALRLGIHPNDLKMDVLNITGLQGELIISDDKTVNVIEAFKTEEESSRKPEQTEQVSNKVKDLFPVTIGRINLDNGRLHFADLSLITKFDTVIHELNGSITDVSSLLGTRSKVSLGGRVDQYGTSKIEGEINFFAPKKFTDISFIFENLEMTNLAPYSAKFAGRKIDSGRLSLDLEYLIEDSRLHSHNAFVIEALVLGERVESPDAVDLPLDLAIALLKDSRGIIDIRLPITGSLEDPEFSYSQVLWQAATNLLGKIITSPFRALAALFGAEEETLNEVLFEPGSDVIPPAEEEKLDTLLKALQQRPLLKLIITGRYDADADRQELKKRKFRRNFAQASGIELEPGEDLRSINLRNADTQAKLTKIFVDLYGRDAYEQIHAAMVPPNGNQEIEDKDEKTVDARELAQRLFVVLVERVTLDPGVLGSLADKRAAAIVTYMTGAGQLDIERIVTQPSQSIGEDDNLSVLFEIGSMEE